MYLSHQSRSSARQLKVEFISFSITTTTMYGISKTMKVISKQSKNSFPTNPKEIFIQFVQATKRINV